MGLRYIVSLRQRVPFQRLNLPLFLMPQRYKNPWPIPSFDSIKMSQKVAGSKEIGI
jgi:hypothetical protein